MRITFEVDGRIKFIYDDELGVIAQEVGAIRVKRASHVEPYIALENAPRVGGWTKNGWTANMAPVGGPVLGPFSTRAEALCSEIEWLTAHNLPWPTED